MSPELKDLDELMNRRFSCRGFLPKTVEKKIIDQIIKFLKNIFDFEFETTKLGIIRIRTANKKIAGTISFNPIS